MSRTQCVYPNGSLEIHSIFNKRKQQNIKICVGVRGHSKVQYQYIASHFSSWTLLMTVKIYIPSNLHKTDTFIVEVHCASQRWTWKENHSGGTTLTQGNILKPLRPKPMKALNELKQDAQEQGARYMEGVNRWPENIVTDGAVVGHFV